MPNIFTYFDLDFFLAISYVSSSDEDWLSSSSLRSRARWWWYALCQSFLKINKNKRSQWIANRLITSDCPNVRHLYQRTIGAALRHNTRGDTSSYLYLFSCAFVFVRVCNCISTIWAAMRHNDKMNLTIPLPFDLNWPWKVMILMTYICAKIDKLCRWGRWCRWCADDVDISKVIDRDWFWILMSPGNCDTVIKGHQLSFHRD